MRVEPRTEQARLAESRAIDQALCVLDPEALTTRETARRSDDKLFDLLVQDDRLELFQALSGFRA